MELRYKGDVAGARTILYEILVDGDAGDIELARHLLSELDSA
jgi:hypothetical protein